MRLSRDPAPRCRAATRARRRSRPHPRPRPPPSRRPAGTGGRARRCASAAETRLRIRVERGLDDLVVGQPGLHEHPRAGAAPADETGSPGEQRERLLRGSVAGRQQLLVEVEERDCVGLDDAVERGLGADVDTGRAPTSSPVTSTTSSPASASSSSRTRVTPARRFRNRVEWQRRQTGGRTVAHRGHSRSDAGCTTAAPHRSHVASSPHAAHASSRARPVRFNTHTTVPGDRSRRTSASEYRPVRSGSGVLRMSTTSSAGHPWRSALRLGATSGAHASASRRRARRREHDGHAGSSSALDRDIARVPGRHALVLQGFVVLVDHDDHGRARAPVPTPRSGRRS